MGHYSIGEQILGSYEVGKHGDPLATHESNSNSDLPSYAHGFYSLSLFESFSEVVYSKIEIGYDKGAREMEQVVRGAPLELYTPRESLPDPGSSSPSLHAGRSDPEQEEIVMKHPPKEVVAEILKAQQQVMFDLEEIEVEELIIRRKVRKRKVALRESSRSSRTRKA